MSLSDEPKNGQTYDEQTSCIRITLPATGGRQRKIDSSMLITEVGGITQVDR